MAINLPLESPVVLPPDPADSAPQVAAALAAFQAGQGAVSIYRERLGWRGTQQLRWDDESNRGFLRCVYGLMCAATAIGEEAEITRTRQFLLELDPANHFGVERL